MLEIFLRIWYDTNPTNYAYFGGFAALSAAYVLLTVVMVLYVGGEMLARRHQTTDTSKPDIITWFLLPLRRTAYIRIC